MYRPIASLLRCAGSFARQSGWSGMAATLSPSNFRQLQTSCMLECNKELFVGKVQDAEDDSSPKELITLRTIVTGPEAGSIIGRGGEIINYIRHKSGAKIRIEGSSASQENIITVDGTTGSILKAYTLICKALEGRERQDSRDGRERFGEGEEGLKLNLLVPSSQCGAIIGKGGSKIKEIRDTIGVAIHVSGEPLPGSSERSVKVSGSREEVTHCIYHICCALLEYPSRGDSRLYRPHEEFDSMRVFDDDVGAVIGKRGRKINEIRQISGAVIDIKETDQREREGSPDTDRERIIEIRGSTAAVTLAKSLINQALDMDIGDDRVERESHELFDSMSVSNDDVGAVIGKRGAKINEIRQISGAIINIKETDQREREWRTDTDSDRERIIEIRGSTAAVTLAKSLINQALDMEGWSEKVTGTHGVIVPKKIE